MESCKVGFSFYALPCLVALLVTFSVSFPVLAQEARVYAVSSEFDEGEIWIHYSLSGQTEFEVSLFVNINKAGFLPLNDVSGQNPSIYGDIGRVIAGEDRIIKWRVHDEYPQGFTAWTIVFRLEAVPVEIKKSKTKLIAFTGGAVLVGGLVCAFVLCKSSDTPPDDPVIVAVLASPPVRPSN